MLRQRLTLLLLVLLTLLQGLTPLLHAHAGVPASGEAHLHLAHAVVSADVAHGTARVLQADDGAVIDSADGLARNDVLAVADVPDAVPHPLPRIDAALLGGAGHPIAATTPPSTVAFPLPPARAPPFVA